MSKKKKSSRKVWTNNKKCLNPQLDGIDLPPFLPSISKTDFLNVTIISDPLLTSPYISGTDYHRDKISFSLGKCKGFKYVNHQQNQGSGKVMWLILILTNQNGRGEQDAYVNQAVKKWRVISEFSRVNMYNQFLRSKKNLVQVHIQVDKKACFKHFLKSNDSKLKECI